MSFGLGNQWGPMEYQLWHFQKKRVMLPTNPNQYNRLPHSPRPGRHRVVGGFGVAEE